ncbi:crossover junction endodeoxyribonuclease RuvC [Lolliginicoccus suaedae]|uniref:crossover junction endodeoxyribonuclease RuvC n=1 Tax=Lolliginicoccus suaedae TaxID=2605429 RepID=UPI0011ECECAD|nr:crossover junction endodeoxyribonuclease RuvC [Lolliginicoccus suaedae]
MRVMGVDPGLTRCGLGIVDSGTGRSVAAVAVDVVRTPPDLELSARLLRIATAAEEWMDKHRPDVVAIERVFSQQNVRSVMGTAQAGGVVALAAARRGIPVSFHTPSQVKSAVTGDGSAGKEQVTAMVTRILKMAEAPRPADAADALALAICHCWRAPMLDRMAEAEAAAQVARRKYTARLAAVRRAQAAEARKAEAGKVAAGKATTRTAPRGQATRSTKDDRGTGRQSIEGQAS